MNYKHFIITLLLSLDIIAQQNPETLQGKLDLLFNDRFFESSIAAVDVYDLTESKILYQKNNKLLLHPASNMKIFTSAAALLFLGPDYQFTTRLCYTGKVVNETLYGDMYVIGGFDPIFSYEDLDSFVNAVSLLGISEITGNLYGDVSMFDSLYWGEGWMWDDGASTDAPYLSSLNMNKNSITVIAKGTKPGRPADISLQPATEYFSVINESLTSDNEKDDDIFITRDWVNRNNNIIAKGVILPDSEEVVELNVIKPEMYFLTLFQERLTEAGIRVTGKTATAVSPYNAYNVYTFNRGLDTVLVFLNKTSHNLSAEMIVRAMSAKYYENPASAENGLRLIDSLAVLAGFDPKKYKFADGSGISRYNLVTTELIMGILKYFYYTHPELYGKLYNSFPIAGVDGTLKTRMKDSKSYNNVHAKTGTLTGASSLSGYLTASNGNIIAFSIMIQNHVRNNSAARGFQNELCNILANYR